MIKLSLASGFQIPCCKVKKSKEMWKAVSKTNIDLLQKMISLKTENRFKEYWIVVFYEMERDWTENEKIFSDISHFLCNSRVWTIKELQ